MNPNNITIDFYSNTTIGVDDKPQFRAALRYGKQSLTLNLEDYSTLDAMIPDRYYVWLKNYSELNGWVDKLIATGMVEEELRTTLTFPSTSVVLVKVVEPSLRNAIDKKSEQFQRLSQEKR